MVRAKCVWKVDMAALIGASLFGPQLLGGITGGINGAIGGLMGGGGGGGGGGGQQAQQGQGYAGAMAPAGGMDSTTMLLLGGGALALVFLLKR